MTHGHTASDKYHNIKDGLLPVKFETQVSTEIQEQEEDDNEKNRKERMKKPMAVACYAMKILKIKSIREFNFYSNTIIAS